MAGSALLLNGLAARNAGGVTAKGHPAPVAEGIAAAATGGHPAPVAKRGSVSAGGSGQVKTLQIKNITIGAGRPKIVVPIVAGNADEALARADALARRRDIAVVELRIDALPPVRDPSTIAALSRQIYARLPQHIVLLTFRTQAEGGLRALTDPAYGDLYVTLLREGQMDLLDVEMMREREIVTRLVSQAHRAGVGVVMSNHDFHATPPQAEIVRRLRQQQALGADILKIAVMPRDGGDALRLMNATWEMFSRYAERPLLTMAMGSRGVVTRLAGELTGSALTFGKVGGASAPGQIDAAALHSTLNTIHQAVVQGS
ncbi:3-dehydroquinate dehydratase, type I [Sodalis praecaptivus]|uniref:3-dehydroquinate dehydratase n=2 Tax=Bruguierivoracaceae TaxID=2812006 RepID=W0I2R0_9GAMM|nr:3-dehydroquinate dehydratase, type I [Sodalis praecaptivus]